MELPIFPLQTVLFPGSALPLRVFEQRYMDMVKDCLKDEQPFGICLIAAGAEVGVPAMPYPVGVTARIVSWDMQQLGVLNIVVRGEQRFRILNQHTTPQGLLRAEVAIIPEAQVQSVPEPLRVLLPLLQAMASEVGPERMPPPHQFEDAAWVGYRFAEMLPIPPFARQKLLELDDPQSRLEIVRKFLEQRGLVVY